MSHRWWVIIAVLLFAGGLVWGLLAPASGGAAIFSAETKSLQDMASTINSLPQWGMFALVLTKNITALLFSFVMSPCLLILPLVTLLLNGWLIGAVAPGVVSQHSVKYLLIGILPHGVFELPALFIGEAAALSFGISAMKALFSKGERTQFHPMARPEIKHVIVSLLLFIPAAAIETFVTPLLLGK